MFFKNNIFPYIEQKYILFLIKVLRRCFPSPVGGDKFLDFLSEVGQIFRSFWTPATD